MTSFLAVIFFGIVAWSVTSAFRTENSLKRVFLPAIILKSLAGIAMGVVYMFYYRVGDTLVFFEDAVQLADFAFRKSGPAFVFLNPGRITETISPDVVQRSALSKY